MGRGASCHPLGGSGLGSPVVPLTRSGRLCGVGVTGSLNFTGRVTPPPGAFVGGGSGPFRAAPDFNILGLRPRDGIVISIIIEETSGFDLPVCRVRLANVDQRLSASLLTKEQTSFRALIGWNNPGLESHGTFIVQRPKFRFAARGAGRVEVEIVAYGEQVKLAASERREVYRKMRDSDIAQRIAERHGFEIDVDRTDLVHDQVIQANESDHHFLARRALLHGFLTMVEDGVLKFHRPRPCDSGIRLTVFDPSGGGGNGVTDVMVQSRTLLRGARLQMSQIDPITKEEFTIRSGETPDPWQRETGFSNWADLVTIPGENRPERFMTNIGHEQRRPELQRQVDRMAEASRYVLSGTGAAIGLETLRPQQIITLNNIGRSSGKYIVTRVTHEISGEGDFVYRTRFEVVRAGTTDPEGKDKRGAPVATEPVSAGVVAV